MTDTATLNKLRSTNENIALAIIDHVPVKKRRVLAEDLLKEIDKERRSAFPSLENIALIQGFLAGMGYYGHGTASLNDSFNAGL